MSKNHLTFLLFCVDRNSLATPFTQVHRSTQRDRKSTIFVECHSTLDCELQHKLLLLSLFEMTFKLSSSISMRHGTRCLTIATQHAVRFRFYLFKQVRLRTLCARRTRCLLTLLY